MTESIDIDKMISEIHKKSSSESVVFIDNTNLVLSSKREDFKLCYTNLLELISTQVYSVQNRLYYSDIKLTNQETEDQSKRQERQRFYDYLKNNGYFLKEICEKKKEIKLVNAITLDMSRLAMSGKVNSIFLVAGDADYCSVVQEIQDKYFIQVQVGFFGEYCSNDLKTSCSKFINFSDFKETIRKKS